MKDFKKAEREFFSKRCEKILTSSTGKKVSDRTFKILSDRLSDNDKSLLFKYAEEVNSENAETEELLYSGGFFDGIVFAVKSGRV
ncbi:MAG: hypothetical protein HFE59_02420 [Clostridiales bacterium]|jgi:hypothetical protein|nr:hypothetical protein [Clostridiales bacterium]